MAVQPVLINGEWRAAQSPSGEFRAIAPNSESPMQELYPISSFLEIETAINAARETITELLSLSPDKIAEFLEIFADNIEGRSEALVKMAAEETGLPADPRLKSVELPRTTNQLRQAAAAARDRSWCTAVIDTKVNLRTKYGPLAGPVVVFSPNNFPLAFNAVSGGDFAAAVAAGNPVIAKANPGHPGTTKIMAEAALEAVHASGLPLAMVQLIYHMRLEDGFKLVAHPLIGATAFTGSRSAGLALKKAAESAGKLIYLEMSGVNPVIILPEALQERSEEIAAELSQSCTLGAGQFCTNPGLVILQQGKAAQNFMEKLTQNLQSIPAAPLLSQQVQHNLLTAVETLKKFGAEVLTGGKVIHETGYYFQNTLLAISGDKFLEHPRELQTEAFGPSTLLVLAQNVVQMKNIVESLEGNLTGSLYSHSRTEDEPLYSQIEPILRPRVGRLLNDKMPTGVAVSPAMAHGGPYPATGHPGFTSVGIPRALLRFAALQCYDNVRVHRLPPELQNRNPTGKMWRCIDGTWTQADIID